MRRIVTSILPPEAEGRLLAEYLASRFTYHSEGEWRLLLMEGCLLINGGKPSPDYRVVAGDVLEYFPESRPEPEVSLDIKILFEDDRFLALNKPPNLPCHPAGIFFDHTLWACLKEGRIPGLAPMEEIHFVNRLDRETSGVVLVAKNADAASWASRQLRRPDAGKTYRVLVEGEFPLEGVDAAGFIGRDLDSRIQKKRRFSREMLPDGQTARTTFRRLAFQNGISLLEAVLFTGRTHQIRATLSSLGYPVVGDKLYGVDETLYLRFIDGALTDEDKRRLRLPAQALHAYSLRFADYAFTAPPPATWDALCTACGEAAPGLAESGFLPA